MADSSWPDPAASRIVTDIQYEQMVAAADGDGIAGSPAQSAVIYGDSTGRQVKIRANKLGLVRGHGWFSGSADIVVPIGANSTGQARVDLVVLRLTRATWSVTYAVKAGTPGVATAPAATQDFDTALAGAGVFEVPLATVTVGAGVTTINPADVTAVSPFLGYAQRVIMPGVASLALLPAPTPGLTALVGDQLYLYSGTASAWRRADWGTRWGCIGGKEYVGNGAIHVGGLAVTEAVFNFDSGAVVLQVGRRYRVEVHFRHSGSQAAATGVFFVREGSLTGTQRAIMVTEQLAASVGYEPTFSGSWSETAGGTRTFIVTGYNVGGTMNIYRTIVDTERARCLVFDDGPIDAITVVP